MWRRHCIQPTTRLLTSTVTCLPIRSSCPWCVYSYIHSHYHIHILFTHLPTYLPTYLLAYLLTYLVGVDMLLHHRLQVTILLYDEDFGGTSEYLGCAQFNLKDSYCPEDEPKKDPIWLPFFFEEPGDGEGEVVLSYFYVLIRVGVSFYFISFHFIVMANRCYVW